MLHIGDYPSKDAQFAGCERNYQPTLTFFQYHDGGAYVAQLSRFPFPDHNECVKVDRTVSQLEGTSCKQYSPCCCSSISGK